ncbi:right-handed parallel beta-helix repeat-containing protein [Lysobacter sp. TAB13]|uniref:right-handed parallel beta-helix repeat-containing protein n=1 Tax=Lysobacter sp. TAB13 TaxID=3233065 RepID=UPI003F9C40D2
MRGYTFHIATIHGDFAVAIDRRKPLSVFHRRLRGLCLPAVFLSCTLMPLAVSAQARIGGEGQAHTGLLWPAEAPANYCSAGVMPTGPATLPEGAILVPAGDNSHFDFNRSGVTFWFETGEHTFGEDIYGQIIARAGNTYLGAPGAILDGKNKNLYAFTNAVDNVVIRYLTIRNFGRDRDNFDQGVVNHDAGDHWTIEYNNIVNNDGAGVFLGSDNHVRYNCLKDNGQYGFSMYKKPLPSVEPTPDNPVPGRSAIVGIELSYNEIAGNNTDDWETSTKCGCTGGGKFWDVRGAKVVGNYVHNNRGTGLWADTNNIDFLFENNYIKDNDGVGIWYEISYNATIRSNTFINNAWVSGGSDRGSPAPAIYLSESGGDSRLQSQISGSTSLRIYDNYFENNFSGVSIYENANRFCNSNGNTSSVYCTPFVHPALIARPDPDHPTKYPDPVSNLHPCYTQIGTDPVLQRDCRWHAKNIEVTNNEFYFDPAVVPCNSSSYCGAQALYATGENNMTWSPYTVQQVQSDVMFNNNNRFANNHYYGPWRFAKRYGEAISFSAWQAAPYHQDAGSTTDGSPFNLLDPPTATLESSAGLWNAWYGSSIARADQGHTGTHSLQVVSSGYWGVQVANHPGYLADNGAKRVSLWVKHAAGTASLPGNSRLRLRWLKEDGTPATGDEDTSFSDVMFGAVGDDWSQVTGTVQPPPLTASVWIMLLGSSDSGHEDATFYVDDVVVEDAPQ